MKEREEISQVLGALRVLTNIMAYQVAGKLKLAEGALLLRRLGLSPIQIAEVYGTTPGSVSVRIAEARRRAKR